MKPQPQKPFPPTLWRRPAVWVALVVLAAAGARIAYVLEVHDHPYYTTPLVDAADYHARAQQVAEERGLGEGVYYKAPAYPWLLGQLYRVTGPRLEYAYAVQMLLGLLATAVLVWLGYRIFGLAAGVIAGLLWGLSADALYFENQALIASPAVAATVVAVAALMLRRGDLADLVAGLAAGLAVQLRPWNGFVVLALVGWLALRERGMAARWRRVLLFVVPVVLLLLPTLRHNRLASKGAFVPISVNGGINFYIGNNPEYDATVAIRPGLRWEALTKRFDALDDPVQWQRNYYAAAWTWMREHPLDALRLTLRKLLLFWNVRGIDRNQDSSVLRQASWTLRHAVPWGLLSFLGLCGLLARRWQVRRHPAAWLLVTGMLGVVAFFVTTRYRFAVTPFLALVAADALVAAVRAARRPGARSRRAVLRGVVAVGIATAVVFPDHAGIARQRFGRPDFDMAQVLARRGEREAARRAYARALAVHPDDPDVVFRFAEHLERLGERAAARDLYARAAALAPESYKPPLALAAAAITAGDLDLAWSWLEEAARRGDPSGRVLYDMALVHEKRGEFEAALAAYRRSLGFHDAPEQIADRHLGAARCLIQLGRPEAAEVHFAAAAPRLADPHRVALERAEAWLRRGDAARALTALQSHPDTDTSARAQYQRSRALKRLGRLEEARAAARRACELDSTLAAYRTWLEHLQDPSGSRR